MTRGSSAPVGRVSCGVDGRPNRDVGSVVKCLLPVNAVHDDCYQYRIIDLFFHVGRWQQYKHPENSLVENEIPLEIFLFLDCPGLQTSGSKAVVGAKVTNMTIDLCYRS